MIEGGKIVVTEALINRNGSFLSVVSGVREKEIEVVFR